MQPKGAFSFTQQLFNPHRKCQGFEDVIPAVLQRSPPAEGEHENAATKNKKQNEKKNTHIVGESGRNYLLLVVSGMKLFGFLKSFLRPTALNSQREPPRRRRLLVSRSPRAAVISEAV